MSWFLALISLSSLAFAQGKTCTVELQEVCNERETALRSCHNTAVNCLGKVMRDYCAKTPVTPNNGVVPYKCGQFPYFRDGSSCEECSKKAHASDDARKCIEDEHQCFEKAPSCQKNQVKVCK